MPGTRNGRREIRVRFHDGVTSFPWDLTWSGLPFTDLLRAVLACSFALLLRLNKPRRCPARGHHRARSIEYSLPRDDVQVPRLAESLDGGVRVRVGRRRAQHRHPHSRQQRAVVHDDPALAVDYGH